MTSFSRRRKAFTLFEVLIALAVFVLAALGIGQAIAGTVDAAAAARSRAHIRAILESRLAFRQASPPREGTSQRSQISGLAIEESLKPFQAVNSEGKAVKRLFELTISARSENPPASDKVSILVYLPESAGGKDP